MKRLLKKKWHRIPLGIMVVVMALVLVAGSAFAAYNVWAGNASVDVVESITVTNTTGDGGAEFTGNSGNYAWAVSLYPGESKTLNVLVTNISSVSMLVGAVGTGNEGVTAVWTGEVTVAGPGSEVLTLTVEADEDAYPGIRTIYFEINRG